jgi:membrane-associated phospholipid phosphatase
MIVIWFLRRWRRVVWVLATYDVLLIAAVLMLEQHYVIDIIAGFGVAGVAIAITSGPFCGKINQSRPTRSAIML